MLTNMHRTKNCTIKTFYFRGGKASSPKFTPDPERNFKWEPLFFIAGSDSPLKNT